MPPKLLKTQRENQIRVEDQVVTDNFFVTVCKPQTQAFEKWEIGALYVLIRMECADETLFFFIFLFYGILSGFQIRYLIHPYMPQQRIM
jgi:hypothetical protein